MRTYKKLKLEIHYDLATEIDLKKYKKVEEIHIINCPNLERLQNIPQELNRLIAKCFMYV